MHKAPLPSFAVGQEHRMASDWTNCLESSFYIVSNKNLFQAERPTSGSCPAARLAMDDIDDDTSSIEASNFPKKKTSRKKYLH